MTKSLYGKCNECPLLDQTLIVGETNCTLMNEVDVLIIAEAPANEEIKANRPLAHKGAAGGLFRKLFLDSGLYKTNHFISNIVLCSNIQDGKTVNPPKEAIDCCSGNLDALIDATTPRVILAMGRSVIDRFEISGSTMKSIRGGEYFYKNIPVISTYHPSYLARTGRESSKYWGLVLEDFKSVYSLAESKNVINSLNQMEVTSPFTYERYYPQEFFNEDMVLIDIQRLFIEKNILFSFRNAKSGEKSFYRIDVDAYYYYVPKDEKSKDVIKDINDVSAVWGKSDKEEDSIAYYESDVRPEIKHSIDFNYLRKQKGIKEKSVELYKLFFDLEVYSAGDRSFPDPMKAERPINAVSFKLNDGPLHIWIAELKGMDQSQYTLPDYVGDYEDVPLNIQFYPNEKSLIEAFCRFVSTSKPDLLSGWNVHGFDIPTLFGRMKRLKIKKDLISPVDSAFFDYEDGYNFYIGGVSIVDQLKLYKKLTYSQEASYKLDSISKKVLGEGKVAYEGTLDRLYESDITKFIEYSGVDTVLLWELETVLGHIDLQNEFRQICSSTWSSSETTLGLVDPLFLSFAKNKNQVCKNVDRGKIGKVIRRDMDRNNYYRCGEFYSDAISKMENPDKSIPGAFVLNPDPGLHDWLVDFDYTALYPSIICSMNIGHNTYVAKIPNGVAEDYIYGRKDKWVEFDIIKNPIHNTQVSTITMEEFDKIVQKNNYIITVYGTVFKNHDEEVSPLYEILRFLLDSRVVYKDQMKDAKSEGDDANFKIYKNRQMAFKILANSFYGALANKYSRFFNNDIATSVTLTGQESIKFLGYHVNEYLKSGKVNIKKDYMRGYSDDMKFDYVSYTDTDSIFVKLGDWMEDNNFM